MTKDLLPIKYDMIMGDEMSKFNLQELTKIDISVLDDMKAEVDVSEDTAAEAIRNALPQEDEEELDLTTQLKQAKDNLNAKLQPIKDKLAEYKQTILDTIVKWQNKVSEWQKKGRDWIGCHIAMIKREVDNIKKKINDMLVAVQNWVKKQLERLKKELAKMIAKMNQKWQEKVEEKAKEKQKILEETAKQKVMMDAMMKLPPMPFTMGSEDPNYDGNGN